MCDNTTFANYTVSKGVLVLYEKEEVAKWRDSAGVRLRRRSRYSTPTPRRAAAAMSTRVQVGPALDRDVLDASHGPIESRWNDRRQAHAAIMGNDTEMTDDEPAFKDEDGSEREHSDCDRPTSRMGCAWTNAWCLSSRTCQTTRCAHATSTTCTSSFPTSGVDLGSTSLIRGLSFTPAPSR